MPAPDEDRLFGDMLVRQGLAKPEHVAECLKQRDAALQRGDKNIPKLAQLLVMKGYLTVQGLQATVKFAESSDPRTTAATVGPQSKAAIPDEAAYALNDPGNTMGKYIRVAKVGSGGMGEVWKAWDVDLGRWAALKFLHNEDPDQLAKFFHEARIAAKLNHPNIASVYEVGRLLDKPFIAMQFVDGQTFNMAFRKKEREAARAIRDAALAVQYSHEQGVIHRDIKPANLMVEKSSRVYVMDFGLAKQLGLPLSGSGTIWGTPAYMSPEQAQGLTLTIRSDVYSLGATLYELVTGKAPFHGENVYQILARVVERAPLSLHALVPGVSRELETIVLKCLEKDPVARYKNAKALAEDLDRYLNGEEVHAHPPSMFYRVRKLAVRRKGLIAAALLGAVAMTVVAMFLLRSAKGDQESLQELGGLWSKIVLAKQGYQNASVDPRKVTADIREGVARVDDYLKRDSRRPQGHFIRAKGLLYLGDIDGAENSLRTALSIAPDFAPAQSLLGRVLIDRYVVTLFSGEHDSLEERQRMGTPLIEEGRRLLTQGAVDEESSARRWGLVMTREDRVAAVLARALEAMYVRKDSASARKILEEEDKREGSEEYVNWLGALSESPDDAIGLQSEAIRRMAHFAKAWADRGLAYLRKSDLQRAARDLDQALLISPRMGRALEWRALVKIRLKEWRSAIPDLDSALELDPRNVLALINRAHARRQIGDTEGAVLDCEEALRLRPASTLARVVRAYVYLMRGSFELAITDCTEVLKIDPKFAPAYRYRARSLAKLDRGDEAMRDAQQAVSLDPDAADGYVVRAMAKMKVGDPPGAIPDFDKAVSLDPTNGEAFANRGVALCILDRFKPALQDFEEAFRLGTRSPTLLVRCGYARERLGDSKGAMRDTEEALQLEPENPEATYQRGCLRVADDPDGAMSDFDAAIRLDPKLGGAYIDRAVLRKAKGDLEGARRDIGEAVRLLPNDVTAHSMRGVLLMIESTDLKGAIQEFTEAIRLAPRSPVGYGQRGMAHAMMGEDEPGILDLEKALELAPETWPERETMRKMLEQLKRRRKQ